MSVVSHYTLGLFRVAISAITKLQMKVGQNCDKVPYCNSAKHGPSSK